MRYEPQHTAFVSMDDETLVALKDDPLAFWAPHFGQAIDVLNKAGVKAVGLDFIYQVSAEGWLRKLNLPDSNIWRNYDSPLRAALACGNVMLITHLVRCQRTTRACCCRRRPALPAARRHQRPRHREPVSRTTTSTCARFFPVIDPDPATAGRRLRHAARAARRRAGSDPGGVGNRRRERCSASSAHAASAIAGPPGTIPTVSMSTLLQPDALDDPQVQALQGQGRDHRRQQRRHLRPPLHALLARAEGDQMAGGEIHANIVETILSGRYPAASRSRRSALCRLLMAPRPGCSCSFSVSVGGRGADAAAACCGGAAGVLRLPASTACCRSPSCSRGW